MKDVVIIADFLGPLDGTYNSRFMYLADMLTKDNNVEIITSDFSHSKKEYFGQNIERHSYPIRMLHEGSYPKNVCFKRFYGHYIWGKNVKKYLEKRKKPDVVYCAVPTLMASHMASKYCKKNNIRFVIDIQDLWPEAFKMVFNVPMLSDIVFFPFVYLANAIYKNADAICAVSDTYLNRAIKVNKKNCHVSTVYLGTELSTFDKNASRELILNKKREEIWVAYCGTLGASYDLKVVIDALHILNNKNVQFIIMGDGPRKNEFEEYAKIKNINTAFMGRLSYDVMCSLLSKCDIAVNPITHMAAQSIINKHADYAAAGLPVINTQECVEYKNLIDKYNMGLNCENSNPKELSGLINELIIDVNKRVKMGENSRKCAIECFDRKKTYNSLVDCIIENN